MIPWLVMVRPVKTSCRSRLRYLSGLVCCAARDELSHGVLPLSLLRLHRVLVHHVLLAGLSLHLCLLAFLRLPYGGIVHRPLRHCSGWCPMLAQFREGPRALQYVWLITPPYCTDILSLVHVESVLAKADFSPEVFMHDDTQVNDVRHSDLSRPPSTTKTLVLEDDWDADVIVIGGWPKYIVGKVPAYRVSPKDISKPVPQLDPQENA